MGNSVAAVDYFELFEPKSSISKLIMRSNNCGFLTSAFGDDVGESFFCPSSVLAAKRTDANEELERKNGDEVEEADIDAAWASSVLK